MRLSVTQTEGFLRSSILAPNRLPLWLDLRATHLVASHRLPPNGFWERWPWALQVGAGSDITTLERHRPKQVKDRKTQSETFPLRPVPYIWKNGFNRAVHRATATTTTTNQQMLQPLSHASAALQHCYQSKCNQASAQLSATKLQ